MYGTAARGLCDRRCGDGGLSLQPACARQLRLDSLIVHKREPSLPEFRVYLQLKSTTTARPDPDKEHFSFRLKHREYFERLAVKRSWPKAILVVMVTSPEQAARTSGDHDALRVLHACYWVSLEGLAVPSARQPTVHVPIRNRFDADALVAIPRTIDQGGDLCNGA